MGAVKKTEKFPIQILSLDKVKVDHALQSRVATSVEYQRDFSEAMLRGEVFPPVTVFWDGKVYWLADGFHRLGAAKQAAKVDPKLRGIRAVIHEGTKRDAMIFSAGSNKEFSIPRTFEDIKKAAFMLFSDPEWFSFSNTVISKYLGAHPTTIKRHREAFCYEKGIDLPKEITYTQQGHKMVVSREDVEERSKKGVEVQKMQPPVNSRGEVVASASCPHSEMKSDEAIAEARRMGDDTPGNGWRRLLWRMADLLEGK